MRIAIYYRKVNSKSIINSLFCFKAVTLINCLEFSNGPHSWLKIITSSFRFRTIESIDDLAQDKKCLQKFLSNFLVLMGLSTSL